MSTKYVPLISSGVAGPLGVLHLPRLWQKVSLESTGQLADGYPGAGQGFDQMVIDGLGLQRDAVLAFIKESKPTYPEFEAWVKSQPGAKLDEGAVSALNSAITGYIHDADTKGSILSANGLTEGPSDAVNLNNLDDWKEFHEAVLK